MWTRGSPSNVTIPGRIGTLASIQAAPPVALIIIVFLPAGQVDAPTVARRRLTVTPSSRRTRESRNRIRQTGHLKEEP